MVHIASCSGGQVLQPGVVWHCASTLQCAYRLDVQQSSSMQVCKVVCYALINPVSWHFYSHTICLTPMQQYDLHNEVAN